MEIWPPHVLAALRGSSLTRSVTSSRHRGFLLFSVQRRCKSFVGFFFFKASRPCLRRLDYSRQAVSQHFTVIFLYCYKSTQYFSFSFLFQPLSSTIQCNIPPDIFSEKLYFFLKNRRRKKSSCVSSCANCPRPPCVRDKRRETWSTNVVAFHSNIVFST